MSDIKSALEIAMEKIAKMGEPTEAERLRWKYLPEGEKLGSRYLKESCNLAAELSQYQKDARKYVTEGAAEVLIRGIDLPRNDIARKNNKSVMDGLKILKSDKARIENVYSQIRYLFNHYAEQGEQQRQQAYQALKADLETKMQQALQQQLGTVMRARIDVERQPQFQQEWRRIQSQIDSQYVTLLNEHKRELSSIP